MEGNRTDFQKVVSRKKDPVVNLLCLLDSQPPKLRTLVHTLHQLKRRLHLSRQEWKELRNRLLLTFFFKKFIERNHQGHPALIEQELPRDVIEEALGLVEAPETGNSLTQLPVHVPRGSQLDQWVRKHYLPEARARYRGVIGYSAEVRLIQHDGGTQTWDDRYITPHANYHWDQTSNSFPCLIYLSSVGPADGPFTVIKDSLEFHVNQFLAVFDRFMTDHVGLDNHPMSDRVGHYLDALPDTGVMTFCRNSGNVIFFEGRSVAHDGGYPLVGGSRAAMFINARNILMGPMERLLGNR